MASHLDQPVRPSYGAELDLVVEMNRVMEREREPPHDAHHSRAGAVTV